MTKLCPTAVSESLRGCMLAIVGPMTGLENSNYDAFNEAEVMLDDLGVGYINPTRGRSTPDCRVSRADYMSRSLTDIIDRADGILLLPDWNASKGAVAEVVVGLEVGLPFYLVAPCGMVRAYPAIFAGGRVARVEGQE